MNYRQEIKEKYTDAQGFILDKPWGGTPGETQNGLLYSAIHLEILRRTGQINLADCVEFARLVQSCELVPGLYTRLPGLRNIEQAHDDYIGIAAMSPVHAAEICEYGRQTWWCFSVIFPGMIILKQCHLRHIGVVPFYKQSAGIKLTWFERLQLAIRSWIPADANGIILNFLITRSTKGLEQAFLEYFGPAHPFTKIAKEL